MEMKESERNTKLIFFPFIFRTLISHLLFKISFLNVSLREGREEF